MKTSNNNTKLIQLWLLPLFIGAVFGSGYSLTKKIFAVKQSNSKEIMKSTHKNNLPNYKSLQKQEKMNTNDVIKYKVSEETIEIPSKNSANKSITKAKESIIKEATYNSLSLETKFFFKRHNINEMLKKLPNP